MLPTLALMLAITDGLSLYSYSWYLRQHENVLSNETCDTWHLIVQHAFAENIVASAWRNMMRQQVRQMCSLSL